MGLCARFHFLRRRTPQFHEALSSQTQRRETKGVEGWQVLTEICVRRCYCWLCPVSHAERRKTDAFELWCWRRLLSVPWTTRRSNQSTLKEISPGCSWEGLMWKLKLQHFGHLMQRADSFEKTLMLGKIEGWRKRGPQRVRWLDGITDSMDMLWVNSRSWWWTGRPGVLWFMGSQSQIRLSDWTDWLTDWPPPSSCTVTGPCSSPTGPTPLIPWQPYSTLCLQWTYLDISQWNHRLFVHYCLACFTWHMTSNFTQFATHVRISLVVKNKQHTGSPSCTIGELQIKIVIYHTTPLRTAKLQI